MCIKKIGELTFAKTNYDYAYFRQNVNSNKAWLQSQIEFERLYERYYRPLVAKEPKLVKI